MFSITRREEETITIVMMTGTLDQAGSKDLTVYVQELKNNHVDRLVFNFSQVNSVMYTSLQEIVTTFRDLLLRSKVAFCAMSPNVHKVIKTAPFYSKLKVFETEAEALEDF